jgi:hypothetical protein
MVFLHFIGSDLADLGAHQVRKRVGIHSQNLFRGRTPPGPL